MEYFDYFSGQERESLFFQKPASFSCRSPRSLLRCAVGALLYTPAANEKIADAVINRSIQGMTSLAICLEDAVSDADREHCIQNMRGQIQRISKAVQEGACIQLPLLFVRVRDERMLLNLQAFFAENTNVLTGVILPKVSLQSLQVCLDLVEEINQNADRPFYAMPILETESIIAGRKRTAHLMQIRDLTDRYYSHILNIRIGATDFCGLYGIRRACNTPIYDVAVVSSCIADIVRVFGLHDRYTISAPVWEYFSKLASADCGCPELNGLLREVDLDLQNALLGKTAIHPRQLPAIQAMYAVSYESYQDASAIFSANSLSNGVLCSEFHNKMNEPRPHELWARKILKRAEIYGVYRKGKGPKDLMDLAYGKEAPKKARDGLET